MLRLALKERLGSVPEGLDWAQFRSTMDKHRIYPLVIRGLRQFSGETLEAFPALKYYRSRQNHYMNGCLRRMQTLAAVAKAMDGAGVPMISMKGPLLSMELYGDPSMRHSHDLDVLVPMEQFFTAVQTLKEMGFDQAENHHLDTPLRMQKFLRYTDHNHSEFFREDQCVELHWRSSHQHLESFEELWANREPKQLLGVTVHEMGRLDKYAHLFAHAAQHGFARLRWLMDLYEIQRKPDFSWEELLERMGQLGNSSLLLETAIVLLRLAPLPMEPVTIGSLTACREGDQVLLTCGEELREEAERAVELSEAAWPMMERELEVEEPEHRAYKALLPNRAIRRSLWRKITVNFLPNSADFELIDLPDRWYWLYHIIRPFHGLWRKLFGGKR